MNITIAYTLHLVLDEEDKKNFWDTLDEGMRGVHNTEKLLIVGISKEILGHQSYYNMYRGFGFAERN